MKRIVCVASALWILSFASTGEARTVREAAYRYDQIWSAAVRFLRVDSGFLVLEQDKETGYVLFEYKDATRTVNGSFELVPGERDGATFVTVGMRIQNMPSYVEVMLVDKFMRKLRDELGEPPPQRRVEAAPKKEKNRDEAEQEKDANKDDSSKQEKDDTEEDASNQEHK
jgi:hypothetical protein